MKTDLQLKNDVEAELRWEPSVREEHIGVSAKDGVVELDGEVGSYAEKWGAERAALRVAEVRAVASKIAVVHDPLNSKTDEDIARAARNALDWDTLAPLGTKVKVSEGWVTLEGIAEWQYRREAAERVVRNLNGVKGVVNNIVLKPVINPSDVRQKIEQAFKRSATVDAGNIQVEAKEGAITLRGKVRSWYEREEAEREAWAAPGVTAVTNLVTIG